MKKIGLIIFALVLALGALGVGYAAWQQTLTISADVQAATFHVYFSDSDISGAPLPLSEGSDVTLVIGDANGPLTSAAINVIGAYPGYSGTFSLTVQNDSSIPVLVSVVKDAGSSDLWSIDPLAGLELGANSGNNVTVTLNIPADATVETYVPGETVSASFTLVATQNTAPYVP